MTKTSLATWEGAIASAAKRYHSAAGHNVKWAQEKVHVMTIIRGSRDLQKAIPESLEQAILQAGSMGLSFNPLQKQCYLIPRKLKDKETGAVKCVIAYPSPSYMGLLHVAKRAGAIVYGAAEIVYQDDRFEYHGPFDKPVHRQSVKKEQRVYQKAIGVYAAVKLPSGDWRSEYLDSDQIARIRSMSDNPGGTMWDQNKLWTEGWKKAALRRLLKTELSGCSTDSVQTAISVLDSNEGIASATEPSAETEQHEAEAVRLISDEQAAIIRDWLETLHLRPARFLAAFGIEQIEDLPADRYDEAVARFRDAETAKQA